MFGFIVNPGSEKYFDNFKFYDLIIFMIMQDIRAEIIFWI